MGWGRDGRKTGKSGTMCHDKLCRAVDRLVRFGNLHFVNCSPGKGESSRFFPLVGWEGVVQLLAFLLKLAKESGVIPDIRTV